MFKKLIGSFSQDIAIDLGTANTIVFVKGKGIVLNEPSVVAIDINSYNKERKVMAIGKEAKLMIGKTPKNIVAIRPMKDGVIADFKIAEDMIKYFIRKVHKRRIFLSPRIIICIPSGATPVEAKAIKDSADTAGARKTYLIEETMAAAIGAKLPVSSPGASMIVDIGGGTTEVAVISLGGIVYSISSRVGGDRMDEDILNYIKNEYEIIIGTSTAEKIKKEIGATIVLDDKISMKVKGRDIRTGYPKEIVVNQTIIVKSLQNIVKEIIMSIEKCLSNTPPELSADLIDKGIVLTGGGSLLKGMDKIIAKVTGVKVIYAKNPMLCVALGCGECLDKIEILGSYFSNRI